MYSTSTEASSPKPTGVYWRSSNHWLLLFYDTLIFVACAVLFLWLSTAGLDNRTVILLHSLLAYGCCIGLRFAFSIYRIVWRYGGVSSYLRLIAADASACLAYIALQSLLVVLFPDVFRRISFSHSIALLSSALLLSLSIRMAYRYFYKRLRYNPNHTRKIKQIMTLFGADAEAVDRDTVEDNRSSILCAIYGMDSGSIALAREMADNPRSVYRAVCFVDNVMAGRKALTIPVFADDERLASHLEAQHVQTIVLSGKNLDRARRIRLSSVFEKQGFSVKMYDQPSLEDTNGKPSYVNLKPEDLLFRKQVYVMNPSVMDYYRGKTVLVTGGGGSIGSELCRQLARMEPQKLIILDIAENGAYDVQQELWRLYGRDFPVRVEIASIRDREAMTRIFSEYCPQIVIHAAAHKHVPLMEKNCIEAVENNVFGTLNVVELCEEFGANHFMMVSTDKAVNPTSVMGATKRLCEMIAMSHSGGKTVFTATRFGNVLGSAGSVIPLFRQQIEAGGPVTITDKRIIRYFMTIPEASQLVLASGAMARDGELFVLDMGNPVKIYDLALTMIKMYGLKPDEDISIIETGLRPGEKLYEELLAKSGNTLRTDNELIFVENEKALSMKEVEAKLQLLRQSISQGDAAVKEALHKVVPTYKEPAELNAKSNNSKA